MKTAGHFVTTVLIHTHQMWWSLLQSQDSHMIVTCISPWVFSWSSQPLLVYPEVPLAREWEREPLFPPVWLWPLQRHARTHSSRQEHAVPEAGRQISSASSRVKRLFRGSTQSSNWGHQAGRQREEYYCNTHWNTENIHRFHLQFSHCGRS